MPHDPNSEFTTNALRSKPRGSGTLCVRVVHAQRMTWDNVLSSSSSYSSYEPIHYLSVDSDGELVDVVVRSKKSGVLLKTRGVSILEIGKCYQLIIKTGRLITCRKFPFLSVTLHINRYNDNPRENDVIMEIKDETLFPVDRFTRFTSIMEIVERVAHEHAATKLSTELFLAGTKIKSRKHCDSEFFDIRVMLLACRIDILLNCHILTVFDESLQSTEVRMFSRQHPDVEKRLFELHNIPIGIPIVICGLHATTWNGQFGLISTNRTRIYPALEKEVDSLKNFFRDWVERTMSGGVIPSIDRSHAAKYMWQRLVPSIHMSFMRASKPHIDTLCERPTVLRELVSRGTEMPHNASFESYVVGTIMGILPNNKKNRLFWYNSCPRVDQQCCSSLLDPMRRGDPFRCNNIKCAKACMRPRLRISIQINITDFTDTPITLSAMEPCAQEILQGKTAEELDILLSSESPPLKFSECIQSVSAAGNCLFRVQTTWKEWKSKWYLSFQAVSVWTTWSESEHNQYLKSIWNRHPSHIHTICSNNHST